MTSKPLTRRSQHSSRVTDRSVRLLLDTHIFIWALGEPHKLPSVARSAIENSANEVFVSAAVAWEISIKHALGKLPLPMAPASYVPSRLLQLRFKELSITFAHTLALSGLPTHHADPFDRILIAQAQIEGLTLVSVDSEIAKYPVPMLAV